MFRFRLERILQLKRKLRDAKKSELAYINHVINEVRAELYKVQDAVSSISIPEGLFTFEELSRVYDTLEFLRSREIELERRLNGLIEQREKILRELIEIQREVKILEKLKERKSEEFRKELLRKEVKILDDFASGRIRHEAT